MPLLRWSADSKSFSKMLLRFRGWIRKNAAKVLTPNYHDNEILGLGVGSNGKYVVTCSEKTDLVIIDIKGVLLARSHTYFMNTYHAYLSPCGRYISACVEDRDLLLTGEHIPPLMALPPHGEVMISAHYLFFANIAKLDTTI